MTAPMSSKLQVGGNDIEAGHPYLRKASKRGSKLVRVQFYDPSEFDSRFSGDEAPVECTTVGWILNSDKKFLKLAWIIDNCEEGDYSGLVIPRGCIKQIEVVARPRRVTGGGAP